MTTVDDSDPRIVRVQVTDDTIDAVLADGREVSVPLAWSWRLSEAAAEQRQNFEILGGGLGVRWPDLDEDLSARGLLSGVPARRPRPRRVAS